ncbi:MAG: VWA domain-containing protein [Anaerolineaceae bacterium]|nr:VWA domain-containing protein [Anaerolineaceae bacterium]
MKIKRVVAPVLGISALLLLLVFLAACGGATDEAVEDTSDTDTGAVEDGAESETIADDAPSATGSEEDSGELPPTPETGSKVNTTRVSPTQLAASDTAVATAAPPTNRTNSETPDTISQIDLVLVIDATGSMAPELAQLKAGLDQVATEFSTLPGEPALRYGFVVYRDQDKGESTQLFALTDNWTLFAENLTSVTAVGGGNYSEDVQNGLYQAVANMHWQPAATKLLIVLGDAPPHQSIPDAPTIEETTLIAAERNITIYTIGSDGINEAGMAIFQQIAESHNGRFIYLTDMPEDMAPAATNAYATTDLPTLLVDIVTETLNDSVP